MTRDSGAPSSRRERRAQARLERAPEPRRRQDRRAARPAWQSPVVLASVAAVLIGLVLIVLALPREPSSDTGLVTPPTSYPAAMVDGDVLGAPEAPVVIELYSDFQCPACKLFATERLPRLVTEFVTPGTVRIEARDIAFLGQGTPNESLELAAGAACAAAQNRYWTFHDLVFWNQGRENRGDHDAEFIARIADAAGVDRTVWDACIGRSDVRPPIDATTASALAAGISSTPTLVVNGQSVVGVPDYDQLAALIRQLAGAASPAPGSTGASETTPAPPAS